MNLFQKFKETFFSVFPIMAIVLFYQKGIMGENEFSISGILKFLKNLKSKFFNKKIGGQKETAEAK